jgi:phosphatidate phosphatase APP1
MAMPIANILLRALAFVEGRLDRVRYRLKRFTGFGPLRVVVFRGHGRPARFRVWGRVLEDRGVETPSETDSLWKNMLDMYRRFASREVPNAAVRIRVAGQEVECRTNDEGYFRAEVSLRNGRRPGELWHPIRVIASTGEKNATEADGEVMIPPREAEFGVISDIDDTILQTGATRFLAMLRQTVAGNARTRRPFEGVAAFYRSLQIGQGPGPKNPIFYVSSSPWNLYDFMVDFMDHQGIPKGPLYLRDLGIEKHKFIKTSRTEHKLACIRSIMDAHPDLTFVLIGDSGQDDPEIYRATAEEYPGRVRAIYIRDVEPGSRGESVLELARELEVHGVPLVLAPDTLGVAEHAAGIGLIPSAVLGEVRADRARDKEAPDEFESLVSAGSEASV